MANNISDVENKVNEYLTEFSSEKALDIAETMREVAKETKTDFIFWSSVVYLLKRKIKKISHEQQSI